MSKSIDMECTYMVLSYLQNDDIKDVDKKCLEIVRNRSAVKLQNVYKKWIYEMHHTKYNSRVYIKRYLPLTFRNDVAKNLREVIISEAMNNMMYRFNEMTYNENSVYRAVRSICDRDMYTYKSYSDFETNVVSKVPALVRAHKLDNVRDIVIDCIINDISCEWFIRGKVNMSLTKLVDIVVDTEVLDYYMDLYQDD